jgi:hemerythrin superfamily protein
MTDAQHSVDALALLHEQHVEVDALFREMERLQPEAQGGGDALLDERRRVVDQIVAKLMQHANVEEEHFYPALREAGAGELADEAQQQHREAERVTASVDRMSPDNLDFDERIRALITDVREHVRLEETEIFPRIEAALTAEQRQELGGRLTAAMKHAPTRPHPHSPSPAGGVGKVMARGAAVADRLRNAASRRQKG